MPIKKENKSRYPKDWKEISRFIRFMRAKNKCEFCGVKNYSVGYWDGKKFVASNTAPNSKKLVKIILTVAHLDHTPENCNLNNLRALCQRCHLNYDKQEHIKNRKKNTAKQ